MSGLIKPDDMKFVPKRWGSELWIVNNEKYCGKILFIKKGEFTSFHWHQIKDEVLKIESGECWFNYRLKNEYEIKSILLKVGDAFHVEPFDVHQMYAVEDTYILEFSTQHFDEDSYRETMDLVINHD